jgi:hypothetical protein
LKVAFFLSFCIGSGGCKAHLVAKGGLTTAAQLHDARGRRITPPFYRRNKIAIKVANQPSSITVRQQCRVFDFTMQNLCSANH